MAPWPNNVCTNMHWDNLKIKDGPKISSYTYWNDPLNQVMRNSYCKLTFLPYMYVTVEVVGAMQWPKVGRKAPMTMYVTLIIFILFSSSFFGSSKFPKSHLSQSTFISETSHADSWIKSATYDYTYYQKTRKQILQH